MILTQKRTEEFRDQLLSTILAALKDKEYSARFASIEAVGHEGLIKSLKAGTMPSVDRIDALCELLGLDFYIGPHRETGPVQHTMIDDHDYASIPRLDIQASAGPGRANTSPEVIGQVAFRRDWLNGLGIDPAMAFLVGVSGDSMSPTLNDSDLVLIDSRRKTIRANKVFALSDITGETLVKRVSKIDGEALILTSDNPEHGAILRKGQDMNDVEIIGQVVWSGHKWS